MASTRGKLNWQIIATVTSITAAIIISLIGLVRSADVEKTNDCHNRLDIIFPKVEDTRVKVAVLESRLENMESKINSIDDRTLKQWQLSKKILEKLDE